MNEEQKKAEELKRVELMMHECKAGKKIMKFLKNEGYKIQSGFAFPDKASISPEKKTVFLDTDSIVMHNEYTKGEVPVDYAPAAKERCVLSLVEAACLIKQQKYDAEFFEKAGYIEGVNNISRADVKATQALFVSQMEKKHPELVTVFNNPADDVYPQFKETMKKTGNENAARSAAVEQYLNRNTGFEPQPNIQDRKDRCTDFDGKSYYIRQNLPTLHSMNVLPLAATKAKRQGR